MIVEKLKYIITSMAPWFSEIAQRFLSPKRQEDLDLGLARALLTLARAPCPSRLILVLFRYLRTSFLPVSNNLYSLVV